MEPDVQLGRLLVISAKPLSEAGNRVLSDRQCGKYDEKQPSQLCRRATQRSMKMGASFAFLQPYGVQSLSGSVPRTEVLG